MQVIQERPIERERVSNFGVGDRFTYASVLRSFNLDFIAHECARITNIFNICTHNMYLNEYVQ